MTPRRAVRLALRVAPIAICLVFAAACEETQSLDLAGLSDADRAEVRSNHDELLASLDLDAARSAAALIAKHADGWYAPWYGTPVAEVRLHFYKGEQALGTIGVGDSFLTAGAAQMLFNETGE